VSVEKKNNLVGVSEQQVDKIARYGLLELEGEDAAEFFSEI
jgi:hypothetical protein